MCLEHKQYCHQSKRFSVQAIILFILKGGVIIIITLVVQTTAQTAEFFGSVGIESRYFNQMPFYPEQRSLNNSVSLELEYFNDWSNETGTQYSVLFKPFFRLDSVDSERSHFDIRELLWVARKDNVTLKAGFGKVFWGATEFYHLVDTINQTDLAEAPDGESKLGQPMITVSAQSSLGETEFFLLPGFRERTFPDGKGRFRSFPILNADRPIYESKDEDQHVDWALRWSQSIGRFDVGVSYFNGTDRNPLFVVDEETLPDVQLRPFYAQIAQTSVDIQATLGNWLWKLEALHSRRRGDSYAASTGGFEYSFVGVLNSRNDLGVVLEYMYDERGNDANHFQQDDIALGLRLALNDEQSTEFLMGFIQDQESDAEVWNLEFSRRLAQDWKLNLEGSVFRNIPDDDVLFGFRQDDYLGLELNRYF